MTRLRPPLASLVDETEPPERPFCITLTNDAGAAVNDDRIESAVRLALADSAYDRGAVNVAIVDDATIHDLNRRFLAHDYPTDVLSFALESNPPRIEGEIVVSVDTAKRCAAKAGWSADDELLLYVVHGALHLAGHLDETPEAAARMRTAEAAVLDRLGAVRSSRDSRWQSHAVAAVKSPSKERPQ